MRTKRGRFVLGVIAAVVVLIVVAIVGVASGWIGSHKVSAASDRLTAPALTTAAPTPTASILVSSASALPTDEPSESPAIRVPKTNDSTVFARALATLAFSYDTRTESRDKWRKSLASWLGPDGSLDTMTEAQGDVDRVIPGNDVWTQMRALHQRATFDVAAAYVPQQAVAAQRDYGNQWPPGTSVITVRGNQSLSWDGGSQTTVRTMTIFVICQPTHPYCMVDRIPPQVIS